MTKSGYVKIGGSQRLRRQQNPESKLSTGFAITWKRILANAPTKAKVVKVVTKASSMESLHPVVSFDECEGAVTKLDPHWNSGAGKTTKKLPYIVFTHTHPCHERGEDDDLYCGWWSDDESDNEENEYRNGWTAL